MSKVTVAEDDGTRTELEVSSTVDSVEVKKLRLFEGVAGRFVLGLGTNMVVKGVDGARSSNRRIIITLSKRECDMSELAIQTIQKANTQEDAI